jgi:hypothetical protein
MGTIMPFFGIGRYGQKRGGRHFVGQKRSATRRLDHALRVGEGDRVGNSTSGSNRASGPSRLSCEDRKRQTGRDPEGPRSTLGPTALKVGSPHTHSHEGVGPFEVAIRHLFMKRVEVFASIVLRIRMAL